MTKDLPISQSASIGRLLDDAVQRWGARIALRRRRQPLQWSVLTWTEMGQQVRSIGAALLGLGVGPGDRVAVLASTRLEWSLLDYGILSIGAVTVPVYHSSTPGQVRYVLADSDAKVVVVEDRPQLEKVQAVQDQLPNLGSIVVMDVMDLRAEPKAVLLDELTRDGRRVLREKPGLLEERRDAVDPSWLATIVYTSGTTGVPKGVRLSHANLIAAMRALTGVLDVGLDDTTVLCLPLSHIYGRLGQYAALTHGFCIAYARRVDLLAEVLREVRPTFFFGVPRLYERIYHRVVTGYRDMPPLLKGLVRRGVEQKQEEGANPAGTPPNDVGLTTLTRLRRKLDVAGKVADHASEAAANKAVFEPVREALGGRVRFCISGGAPLNEDVGRFFRMAGIEVLEGYGLTETCGAATINPPTENRVGTVGRPLPGTRIRIAPDGEVLIQGDMVFGGYHNQPDETALSINEEGWLHTGDVGHFDEAGYLVITDRKKDILITSGAKNVAPQRVESALRMSPYIGDAMVFGDRKPYLVALITLEAEEVRTFAAGLDLPTDDWGALVREPRVEGLIEAEVERCNGKLARFEEVRRFKVLQRPLSVEGGELTPTLKVRRATVQERYQPLIEGLYEGGPV
ncbi:MAG: long-chain fatty acid--CoA ligase [Proteobacteria bacterium]|nr:long-chain fatty acid--CoA ligase [Pseudomonadota bacterium]